jgi:hypothetical protein
MAAFRRAVKHEAKLRMALAGPAGSGKTFTAMVLAAALAEGAPFALVDTEHGSASKYADLFAFDVLELDSFHPDRYVEAIHEAEAAGYPVLVIDSLSHAWSGKDGILEQVERLTKLKHANNSFRAWADATPIQNRLIDALTGAMLHVIATLRSKTEYVVETNERGKATPRKIGTAPIQREGVEYEFDLFGELDQENVLAIHKSRCPTLSGAVIARPGPVVAETLRLWLQGTPMAPLPPLRIQASVSHVSVPADIRVGDMRTTPRSPQPDGRPIDDLQPEADELASGGDSSSATSAPASQSVAATGSSSTSAAVAADSSVPTARRTLTERARELGYEGEAWMMLVYRLTGKRDPRQLTGEDKTKLAVYLGRLAKRAARGQPSARPGEAGASGEEQTGPSDSKIGA